MIKYFILFMILLFQSNLYALPLEGLTDIEGRPAQITHNKNTELVLFWATWCSTCKEKLKSELPKVDASKNVAVITVNTDKDPERTKHFIKKEEVKLPVLLDPAREYRKAMKVFSVPHWAVYKRETAQSTWRLIDSAPAFDKERIGKALGEQLL